MKSMMLDCETISLENPLVYDLGCFPINGNGEQIGNATNHVVYETFYEKQDQMKTAYYANKLPQYRDDIWEGVREVMDFLETRKRIIKQMKEEGITAVCAHNARFDIRALNYTISTITNGRIKYFFPYGTEVWDTYKMARQVLGKMPTYRKFCEQNGYMTKHKTPRPRYTAEIIYRFITKDNDFIEAHTGLKDVAIESQIFGYLMRQHKACDRVLYHAPKA